MLHFNDVYNIEERAKASTAEVKSEPVIVAGASRFVTAFEQRNMHQKLVLFSGDLFSPSHLSTFLKGEQMVKVFNSLNVAVSCLGNHDLDFGIERMKELTTKTGKWLLSNLNVNGKPIGNLETYAVREVPLACSESN